MTTRSEQSTKIAMEGVISELARLLSEAAGYAAEAEEAIKKGERNLAVGTLLSAEAAIQAVGPLFAATISLHRNC
jgi:hypothetical protein